MSLTKTISSRLRRLSPCLSSFRARAASSSRNDSGGELSGALAALQEAEDFLLSHLARIRPRVHRLYHVFLSSPSFLRAERSFCLALDADVRRRGDAPGGMAMPTMRKGLFTHRVVPQGNLSGFKMRPLRAAEICRRRCATIGCSSFGSFA